jgi:2-polyprenyl-3-methyl-5-hydroxy-6-metoxy-1,4-benzoquinol methylase
MLSGLGFSVTGVDSSESGIAQARTAFPGVQTPVGSAYEVLAATYGNFPLVVSLEVIEHCFEQRDFTKTFLVSSRRETSALSGHSGAAPHGGV